MPIDERRTTMRSFEFVREARKNPKLNPKISINQAIDQRLLRTKDSIAGVLNGFVSFTDVAKLGINPKSNYDTPLGIYAYPISYVHQQLDYTEHPIAVLPFAGEAPYANIFSVTGNIINLSELTSDDVERLLSRLSSELAKVNAVADVSQLYADAKSGEALVNSPGGHLWYVFYQLSEYTVLGRSKPSVTWNTLFRKIGIDGCVDNSGIIHENEPTQAVFFSTSVIRDIERVSNKYSPSVMHLRQTTGKSKQLLIQKLKTANTEQIIELMSDVGNLRYIDYVKDPAARMELIRLYPFYAFPYMSTPSKEETYAAIEARPQNIEKTTIDIPPAIFLKGLKNNPESIHGWLELMLRLGYDARFETFIKDLDVSKFVLTKSPSILLSLPKRLVTYEKFAQAMSSPLLTPKVKLEIESKYPEYVRILKKLLSN